MEARPGDRQRRELGRRLRHHRGDLQRADRRRRRCRHAGQSRLGPARGACDIERAPRLIRPVNYPKGTPGRGAALVDTKNGKRALVINAMGRVFMDALDDPFAAIERELAACALKVSADAIVLDMHCEATSEKQSMGYFVDGRVSLMVGTHTHCPTADHRIMPGRTAFVSDVGMTGDFESVIGMTKDEPLNRFLRKVPGGKFEPASGPATLCAIAVETDTK